MSAEDPELTPWHRSHTPKDAPEPASWPGRCAEWCASLLRDRPEQTLRTHLQCEACGFGFVVRTTNWSMRASADVENFGTCCNPDCRHTWREIS